MPRRDDAPRDLLFGLLALQNGLVTRDQLVAAFGAWTAAPGPADGRPPGRAGGPRPRPPAPCSRPWSPSTSSSTAATPRRAWPRSTPAARPARAWPRLGDPELDATLAHVGSGSADRAATPTAPPRYAVGTATVRRPAVPRPAAPRPGRPGRGLRRPRRGAAPRGGPEADPRPPRRRPRQPPRFLLEAEITGGLEHPGIVPVYGLGTYADGRPYYAMRFIRGDSLKEAIDRFHADAALKARPRPAVAGAAQAAAAVPRRLQRDRLRPQPGGAAPRPQAGQHHARPVRRDAGRRLGPGQGRRPGRAGARRRTSGR